MIKKVHTSMAPAAIGPYAQANIIHDFIFTSGQLPVDANTGEMKEGIKEQTEQSILNIQYILESQGSSLDKVIKTTVFISDMNNFKEMNEVYATLFTGENLPARSCVEVARLPKDALVEIEAIALV